jgi:hypothetical protein
VENISKDKHNKTGDEAEQIKINVDNKYNSLMSYFSSFFKKQ